MAVIDRIKWDSRSDDELVWKWPADNLRLGSQLIVNQSQEALFFKGGRALDLFGPGTHTLSTRNLPLIGGLVNLPFGGETPFAAEVWFISQTAKLDLKWGTAGALQVLDPKYSVPVSLRAFGQYGVRVADARSFLQQLVGARDYVTTDQVLNYFASEIVQRLSTALAQFLFQGGASVFHLAASLNAVSAFVREQLQPIFSQFGIELVSFSIARTSIPDEELARFQTGFDRRMEMENVGRAEISDTYTRMRQLDALANLGSSDVGALFLGNAALTGGLAAAAPMGSSAPPQSNPPLTGQSDPAAVDPADRLRRLKRLHEEGLLTDEEFTSHRDAILKEL
jgi:membrane protease subunit (stomatin/prohibitin family)